MWEGLLRCEMPPYPLPSTKPLPALMVTPPYGHGPLSPLAAGWRCASVIRRVTWTLVCRRMEVCLRDPTGDVDACVPQDGGVPP
eukprot:5463289-Pyramimonas_sp.AAC.1